ncbi:MAG: oxidoreductase domain protein [Rhodocyclaceae bacterium]|nr:oxidoreductase domain protein [Rhodocyclaceae bacterium]
MAFERVLIAGHGSIGKRHLRIVRDDLPDADIRVLRHQPAATTPDLADGCFSGLADALAFLPQIAILATPAPYHLDAALALADQGCHLLIEKPLAHTSTGVQPLLALARRRGIALQVGYNLRFLPSLARFRELIQAGAIGRVLSVRCEIGQYLPSWRPDTDYRKAVSANASLGGGVLLELSHELDYLRWIFGEVAWVQAWLGRLSNLEIDVEDTAHLTLGFETDGAGAGPVAALSLDFLRRDTTRQCLAIGEGGSLRWNALAGSVEQLVAGSSEWEAVFVHRHQRDDSYIAQWHAFLDGVRNSGAPLVSGDDGLAVLRIIDAARASAAAQGLRMAPASE